MLGVYITYTCRKSSLSYRVEATRLHSIKDLKLKQGLIHISYKREIGLRGIMQIS